MLSKINTNKKAGILQDNAIYLILLVLFFIGMIYAIMTQMNGAYSWSDYYAKETAKLINLAKPGDEITLDVHKATEIAEKNNVASFSQIFTFDNVNNEICVKLASERKSCYSFYNEVDITEPEIKLGIPTNVLTFKIAEKQKQTQNEPTKKSQSP